MNLQITPPLKTSENEDPSVNKDQVKVDLKLLLTNEQ